MSQDDFTRVGEGINQMLLNTTAAAAHQEVVEEVSSEGCEESYGRTGGKEGILSDDEAVVVSEKIEKPGRVVFDPDGAVGAS